MPPHSCWYRKILIRSTFFKNNDMSCQLDSPYTICCFRRYEPKTVSCAILYNNVGCLSERSQSTVVLTNVWMKQRKSTANDSHPLLTALPTRPPVSGEYGRLDSPWRVRSHFKTLGQPKAGTVTITQPRSPWAPAHKQCDEKELRRRDSTEKAVGLRQRGIRVIIDDQWRAKEQRQTVSSTNLVLSGLKQASSVQWMKWTAWQIPLTNFWRKCDLNW